ncbi:hypothetical protein K6119_04260 [Paracrocinitomix mangrovi]|uniref:hypothetical protein n=1 Tax=Paracrocinitomix mangrovi TaxID=2862509 RepID=UPI001C8DB36F|nr:hypothetical protein [Paracrocinitomix mangrovi]UKN02727.1 hypothetical protein K6119_04260 [Paracrocinitomix mangrovi]
MKSLIFILLLLLPALTFGHNSRNFTKFDFSKIYTVGKNFHFTYSVIKDKLEYKIVPKKPEGTGMNVRSRSEYEEYLLPITTDTIFLDTLILSVQELRVKKGKKFKSVGSRIWFVGENNQREFGIAQLVNSKDFLKIFPFEETWYESGFMNTIQANPALMMTNFPERDTSWTDAFSISQKYSNDKWQTWTDSLNVKSRYNIIGKDSISTALGKVDTWKISATAESKIGRSSLESYFSIKYGFVRINYTLVDGTQLNLELVSVEEKEK